MLDRLDAALRFQQEALNLRAQRQEILAANIANADTRRGIGSAILILPVRLKGDGACGRKETGGVALTLTSLTIFPPRRSLLPQWIALPRTDQPSLDETP